MMPLRLRVTFAALLLGLAGAILAAEPVSRPTGAPPGGFGLGTGPVRDEVPRIKLYEQTPGILAGRETEMDPTEPTLDVYLPEAGKAGAGVLILPGGGYQMLTVPGEGPGPARFFRA